MIVIFILFVCMYDIYVRYLYIYNIYIHIICIYIYIYIYIYILYIYIYIYMYECMYSMVFTTDGFFEAAIESWPE